MTDQFVAEIRLFPFNFAPTGWALCNGQLLPISQNTALFSLLGTMYGGDGRSTFALPNLVDRVALHPGQGAGLTERFHGESGGAAAVTLLGSEMPAHGHTVRVSTEVAELRAPSGSRRLATSSDDPAYAAVPSDPSQQVFLAGQTVATAGGGLPHNNLMPHLALNYCIALQGIFPPRS